VSSLDDDVRARFMERFFDVLSGSRDTAECVLSNLPDAIILDALERTTAGNEYIPPTILEILQKLSRLSENKNRAALDRVLETHSDEDLLEKFNTLFKEDEIDRFVPLDYQQVLRKVVSAHSLSAEELSEVQQLKQTLTDHSVDVNLASIILSIIAAQDSGSASESMKLRLREHCMQQIRAGDFTAVLRLLQTVGLKHDCADNQRSLSRDIVYDICTKTAFIEIVIDAAAQWGKHKHRDIAALVKDVGKPFVEPLLDRLAGEKERTLRQFFLDLLLDLGLMVKEPAIERLRDRRWYVVRNLIIILRELNDASVAKHLLHLLGHPHPRVRQELLQTLLRYNEPVADQLLLEEMDAPDIHRCVRAILMAGRSKSTAMIERLATILKPGILTKNRVELKKAAIQALAEIGDPSALPHLEKVLRSRYVLFPGRAKRLKQEIVYSLPKYPGEEARTLLQNVVSTRSRALGGHAALVLEGLHTRSI